MFGCAALPEMRAELLGRYTREALVPENGAFGPMRQSGALTSFKSFGRQSNLGSITFVGGTGGVW
jgi:hypothetical protein